VNKTKEAPQDFWNKINLIW